MHLDYLSCIISYFFIYWFAFIRVDVKNATLNFKKMVETLQSPVWNIFSLFNWSTYAMNQRRYMVVLSASETARRSILGMES